MNDRSDASDARADEIRRSVREGYGARIREHAGCCGSSDGAEGCCGNAEGGSCCGKDTDLLAHAERLGYDLVEMSSVPEGGEITFGCGNPTAIAALQPGETVLDLGSGGGLDCFLASHRVGDTGRVIGVDMTAEMLEQARASARRGGYQNVEFRLGEIEHLPVADASIDVILSNCVINLTPDKRTVFRDAFRVLKPGGRLAITDVVSTVPLPAEVRENQELWCGCLGGAEEISVLEAMMREIGFEQIRITPIEASRAYTRTWADGNPVGDYVLSATIEAVRPLG